MKTPNSRSVIRCHLPRTSDINVTPVSPLSVTLAARLLVLVRSLDGRICGFRPAIRQLHSLSRLRVPTAPCFPHPGQPCLCIHAKVQMARFRSLLGRISWLTCCDWLNQNRGLGTSSAHRGVVRKLIILACR